MLNITMICVGRQKERFFADACGEYAKRIGRFARLSVIEVDEQREGVPGALRKEAEGVRKKLPGGAYLIAMCIEGQRLASTAFAEKISELSILGTSSICFLVGGSNGLDGELKRDADMCLSMSDMTFPHHLARVMLLEQVYRALSILGNAKYHK